MEKLINVVIGVVENKGKFIMIRRIKKEEKLEWAFPGGKIEDFEDEKEAVIREIFEETNIKAKVIKKLGEREYASLNVHLNYWLCEYVSGELKNKKDEISEVKWCAPKEVFELATTEIFEKVREYILSK